MKIIPFVLIIILSACTAERYEGKARIIERRVLPDNKLLIKYSFKAGEEIITDSVRTRNREIPHDSLKVVYTISDPHKNSLKLP